MFLADRVSKYLVMERFEDLVVINQNGLFGILPWWVSLIGLIGIFIFVFKEKYYDWVIGMILVAGISNLLDRVLYNGVIDFIAVGSFPVFNLADAVISCGVIYLIILETKRSSK